MSLKKLSHHLTPALLLTAAAGAADVPWLSETANDHEAIAAIVEARTFPARGVDRGLAVAQLTELAVGRTAARVVVSFDVTPDAATRAALEAHGVTLLQSLGGTAYFAAVDGTALDTDAISELATLNDAVAIQREWKMSPALLDGEVPQHAIVIDGADPTIALYVGFHRDVPRADARATLAVLGARVVDTMESINTYVVETPKSNLDAIIDDELVQWVEPPLPRMSHLNDSNRAITQVNDVQASPYDLDGAGVVVMVYDGSTARATHQDFNGRLTTHDTSGTHYHPTHVAGTIGGSGTVTAANRGMAPACFMRSFGFEYDGTGTFLYTNPGDLESDYTRAFVDMGAQVSNNSIGSNIEPNGFPCSYQGNYGATSSLIDAIVHGSLGVPVRICWSAGNERSGSSCDVEGYGDYYSSPPPGGNKNATVVGAVNSNDDSMTSFSSWGPTDDGRLRPDVVGPGCQSNGDGGVTSASDSSDTAYLTICGTSMSGPTVTGIVALMIQDHTDQFPSDPLPVNSTFKGLLIQGAVDLGNVGPDYQFGYGSVRVKDSIDHMRTGAFLEESVDQGQLYSAITSVNPGDSELKVTLVWDDAPGAANVAVALVNDLDLKLIDPLGGEHFPWTLDPLNPSAPAVRTTADHLNNTEQVVVDNPMAGTWTVEVNGSNVPEGPQTFSLISTQAVVQTGIQMTIVGGAPAFIDPGTPLDLEVSVTAIGQSLIEDSVSGSWRHSGGAWNPATMIELPNGNYHTSLPVPDCSGTLEYYFSALGDILGESNLPGGGASNPFEPYIGELGTPFFFDFEAPTDEGWDVDIDGTDTATTGVWNRMDPEGTDAQPEDDTTDAGTICWATDGLSGGSLGAGDIDGGDTTLYSPIMDLSAVVDPVISYNRWFSNNTGADPYNDVMIIEITNDGGANWFNVETVGPSADAGGGWFSHEFAVADIVAPTSQVRMRFNASDLVAGSLVEAAIDDFVITSVTCTDSPVPDCPGDVDGDDDVDVFDFAALASGFGAGPGATRIQGDLDGNGFVDVFDFAELAGSFGVACP